jgi:hypothetical protein
MVIWRSRGDVFHRSTRKIQAKTVAVQRRSDVLNPLKTIMGVMTEARAHTNAMEQFWNPHMRNRVENNPPINPPALSIA